MTPVAQALLAFEAIQNSPGITAERLGERLGVTERAARRYVANLRDADLPIESVTGPYGGYRIGRGLRLAPLMFTTGEAMGLIMAVLEGHRDAADPADVVGAALAKIVAVLPERVARPVRTYRRAATPPVPGQPRASPELVTELVESCNRTQRLRLGYQLGGGSEATMEVDPWAVVLRHSRWYLLCWSHTADARRVLRIDRIAQVEVLAPTFAPPEELDALRTLEEHLSQGWTMAVEVEVAAPVDEARRFLPRSLGTMEPATGGGTTLRATTDDPEWYARRLAAIPVPFRVVGGSEIREAVAALARRLDEAAGAVGVAHGAQ